MLRVLVLSSLVAVLVHGAQVFPGKNWIKHTPEQEGMDSAKLKAAFDYAFKGLGETYCTSVHRNGYLLDDRYASGNNYNSTNIIWSVSKAWMATLIGTAERDSKLRTTNLMGQYVPEWASNSKTKNITMETVMRHCSGRYYDVITDFATPQTKPDQTEFSIQLPQSYPPGTHDQYNQMAYQTLQQVFETATGTGIQAASQKELYGPLQMESKTYWAMEGFFTGVPQKHPLVYGGVTTSCPDLARFGWLWLNQGNWSNHIVFTQAFFNKAMSEPQYPFGPARKYGNWGNGPDIKSEGLGRQMVAFNPTLNLVMTRVGSFGTTNFKPGTFMKMVDEAIKDPLLRAVAADSWVWSVAGDEGTVFLS
jgi:CubicO group peptidase (beta-lactamase class C family)